MSCQYHLCIRVMSCGFSLSSRQHLLHGKPKPSQQLNETHASPKKIRSYWSWGFLERRCLVHPEVLDTNSSTPQPTSHLDSFEVGTISPSETRKVHKTHDSDIQWHNKLISFFLFFFFGGGEGWKGVGGFCVFSVVGFLLFPVGNSWIFYDLLWSVKIYVKFIHQLVTQNDSSTT